jgi:hypothetical protein
MPRRDFRNAPGRADAPRSRSAAKPATKRESPRGGAGWEAARLRPDRDPNGICEGFRPRAIPGEAGRPRPSVSPKGDLRGFGLAASPGTGRASARPDPGGKRRRRLGASGATRRDRRGAFGPLPKPTGIRTRPQGFAAEPRGKRKRRRRRDAIQAAQREMASPPSDGSQGWDKWGPVATPAPIILGDGFRTPFAASSIRAAIGEMGACPHFPISASATGVPRRRHGNWKLSPLVS